MMPADSQNVTQERRWRRNVTKNHARNQSHRVVRHEHERAEHLACARAAALPATIADVAAVGSSQPPLDRGTLAAPQYDKCEREC